MSIFNESNESRRIPNFFIFLFQKKSILRNSKQILMIKARWYRFSNFNQTSDYNKRMMSF